MIKIDENGFPQIDFRLAYENEKLTYSGATTQSGLQFVTIEHKNVVTNKSERTIRRKIEKIKKEKPLERLYLPYFLEFMGRYFISEKLFEKKKKKYKKCNRINEEYIVYLKNIKWIVAGCTRYKNEISENSLRKKMENLFKVLNGKYANVIIFFVLQKNDNENGYHVHYVVNCNDATIHNLKKDIKNTMNVQGKYFKAETWLKKYNNKENYIEYMLNYLIIDSDLYDVLANNDKS